MKNLLSLLLIPFLSVSASKLDIDATDYRADENLVLDILLNSESIDVLENLASPLAPLAASNSVFTRLREGKSIPELKSKIRRLKIEKGTLDLVIIDYLQLMSGSTS